MSAAYSSGSAHQPGCLGQQEADVEESQAGKDDARRNGSEEEARYSLAGWSLCQVDIGLSAWKVAVRQQGCSTMQRISVICRRLMTEAAGGRSYNAEVWKGPQR